MNNSLLNAPGPDRIVLAGDWDANTHRACSVVQYAAIRGISTVVQLGDFGIATGGEWLTRFLDALEVACDRYGVTVVFLDGNHEYYPDLTAIPVDQATGMRMVRPHVYHLPRGLRWRWHDTTWMALGGAHSIDRPDRKEGVSWWPAEHLTADDVHRAIAPGPVDVMLCHDAPSGAPIPGLSPKGFPAAQIAAADRHRDLLATVVDATRPALLFHGHYHIRYDGLRGSTTVIGLADDSAPLDENTLVLNLTGHRPMRQ